MTEERAPLLFTVPMRCCRIWPIIVGVEVGRCGICGQRPEPIEGAVVEVVG